MVGMPTVRVRLAACALLAEEALEEADAAAGEAAGALAEVDGGEAAADVLAGADAEAGAEDGAVEAGADEGEAVPPQAASTPAAPAASATRKDRRFITLEMGLSRFTEKEPLIVSYCGKRPSFADW